MGVGNKNLLNYLMTIVLRSILKKLNFPINMRNKKINKEFKKITYLRGSNNILVTLGVFGLAPVGFVKMGLAPALLLRSSMARARERSASMVE